MSLTGTEGSSESAARPLVSELVAGQVARLAVTVSGHDLKGVAFVDDCSTSEIGPNGAVVTLARALGVDQELFLKYGSRERLVRVVGHSGNDYELCFAVSEPQFWGTALKCDDFSEGPLDDFNNDPPTGTDPLLVPNYEEFVESMTRKPVARTAERRRSPRITMRQAKACIEVPGAIRILWNSSTSRAGAFAFAASIFIRSVA